MACFGKLHDNQVLTSCYDTQLSQNRLFFLDGPGGTGTFVYSLLLDTICRRGEIAIAVASTGLAALLMPGGRTVHSRFGIPIPIETQTHCK